MALPAVRGPAGAAGVAVGAASVAGRTDLGTRAGAPLIDLDPNGMVFTHMAGSRNITGYQDQDGGVPTSTFMPNMFPVQEGSQYWVAQDSRTGSDFRIRTFDALGTVSTLSLIHI